MSWAIPAGAAIFASLIATVLLAEWMVRRQRPRKGLEWSDNSPRRPDNTIER
jgi:hypothetical protein